MPRENACGRSAFVRWSLSHREFSSRLRRVSQSISTIVSSGMALSGGAPGQPCTGLIGAQDVHAAKVLDGVQAADQHASMRQHARHASSSRCGPDSAARGLWTAAAARSARSHEGRLRRRQTLNTGAERRRELVRSVRPVRPEVALSHRFSRFARVGRERWRPRISLMPASPPR